MEESNVVMHISIVLCKVNLDFYERIKWLYKYR